jgi:hypothetical protein
MKAVDEVKDIFRRLTLEDQAQQMQDEALVVTYDALELLRQAIEEMALRNAEIREVAVREWEIAHRALCRPDPPFAMEIRHSDTTKCLHPRPEALA